MTSREEAQASPERSVIACILHGDADPVKVARAAVLAAEAAAALPDPRGRLYVEFIERHLGRAARELWRAAVMSTPGIRWRGEFALKHREEGREEGRVEGQRAIVIQLCDARFGSVPGWALERIEHGSLDELLAWAVRVLRAETLEHVFDGPDPS